MEKKGISIKPSSSLNEIYKVINDVLRPEQQVANQLKIVKDGIVIDNPKKLSDVFGTFFVDKVDDIVEDINSKKTMGPFSCNECEEKFEIEAELMKHEETHTNEEFLHCTVCDDIFAHENELKKHEEMALCSQY